MLYGVLCMKYLNLVNLMQISQLTKKLRLGIEHSNIIKFASR